MKLIDRRFLMTQARKVWYRKGSTYVTLPPIFAKMLKVGHGDYLVWLLDTKDRSIKLRKATDTEANVVDDPRELNMLVNGQEDLIQYMIDTKDIINELLKEIGEVPYE
jgi:hypothetical protein